MTYASASDFRAAIVSAFEGRVAYEMSKDSKDSMFAKLKKMCKAVDHDVIAGIMLSAGCDAERINRQERENARYNVYAYEKDINIARAVAVAEGLNHYTLHILKTMKALHDADLTMTHDDAFCACLRGSKPSDTKKSKYISRYDRIEVSKGTASTQSSSSVNALETYKVLIQVRDANNKVAYKLNTESEIAQKLLSLI